MPAQAKCAPGQDGTPAVVPVALTIRPESGDFGSERGTVRLVSNDSSGNDEMDIQEWKPQAIVVWPPEHGPGTGSEEEDFTVQVRVGSTVTYVANPVKVTGPPGTNYPPMHPPMHSPTGASRQQAQT